MKCPVCKSEMLLLFTSAVCEVCEPPDGPWKYRGFVAINIKEALEINQNPQMKYVFKDVKGAEEWISLNFRGDPSVKVYGVLSCYPFGWYPGNGIIKGITLADRLVLIVHNTTRFDSSAQRPYIAYIDRRVT